MSQNLSRLVLLHGLFGAAGSQGIKGTRSCTEFTRSYAE
jgi:hypothetical protein